MLVVERDGALDGGVGDGVAVRQVLGHDARAGFVFLREVVVVGVGLAGFFARLAACEIVEVGGAGYLHLGAAELGVVEEEGGFGGSVGRKSFF